MRPASLFERPTCMEIKNHPGRLFENPTCHRKIIQVHMRDLNVRPAPPAGSGIHAKTNQVMISTSTGATKIRPYTLTIKSQKSLLLFRKELWKFIS